MDSVGVAGVVFVRQACETASQQVSELEGQLLGERRIYGFGQRWCIPLKEAFFFGCWLGDGRAKEDRGKGVEKRGAAARDAKTKEPNTYGRMGRT